MPDDFVWSMDKAAVDTLQAQRLTVLRAMYEASRADVAADVDYAAATMGLDLPADDIGRILRYWEDRGMLRLRHASVTITGRGIDFIEEEIRLTD